jgi:hypothetical protein
MLNTQFSAAVTAARLADGQPVSTAALAHLCRAEQAIQTHLTSRKA